MVQNFKKGWRGDSAAHAAAARGITLGRRRSSSSAKFSTAELISVAQQEQKAMEVQDFEPISRSEPIQQTVSAVQPQAPIAPIRPKPMSLTNLVRVQ